MKVHGEGVKGVFGPYIPQSKHKFVYVTGTVHAICNQPKVGQSKENCLSF